MNAFFDFVRHSGQHKCGDPMPHSAQNACVTDVTQRISVARVAGFPTGAVQFHWMADATYTHAGIGCIAGIG